MSVDPALLDPTGVGGDAQRQRLLAQLAEVKARGQGRDAEILQQQLAQLPQSQGQPAPAQNNYGAPTYGASQYSPNQVDTTMALGAATGAQQQGGDGTPAPQTEQEWNHYLEVLKKYYEQTSGQAQNELAAKIQEAEKARANAIEIAKIQQQTSQYGVNTQNATRLIELQQNQQQFTANLGFQQQQAGAQNALAAGQLTGTYQGAPTLAAQQQAFQQALAGAGLSGVFNGQLTQQAQNQAFQQWLAGQQQAQSVQQQAWQQGIGNQQQALAQAGVTGTYGGQQTQQAQQQAFQQGIGTQQMQLAQQQAQQAAAAQNAQITGWVGTQATLARQQYETEAQFQARQQAFNEQLQTAGITGQINGQQTLQGQAQAFNQQQAQAQLALAQSQQSGWNGTQATLARQQWETEAQFQARQQAFNEQQAQQAAALAQAGVTGAYNGQTTLQAQQQAFQQGLAGQQFGLQQQQQAFGQGIAGRQMTLAEQQAAQQAALAQQAQSGWIGNQATLQRQQFETEAQFQARQQQAVEQNQAFQQQLATTQQQQSAQGQAFGQQQAMAQALGYWGSQATMAKQQQESDEQYRNRVQNAQEQLQQFQMQAQTAGLTGYLGGQQTLQAQQQAFGQTLAGRQQALAESQQTGALNGQTTLGAQQQAFQQQLAAAQEARARGEAVGALDGQQTLGGQQTAAQIAQGNAALTGYLGGQQTLAGQGLGEQIAARVAADQQKWAQIATEQGRAVADAWYQQQQIQTARDAHALAQGQLGLSYLQTVAQLRQNPGDVWQAQDVMAGIRGQSGAPVALQNLVSGVQGRAYGAQATPTPPQPEWLIQSLGGPDPTQPQQGPMGQGEARPTSMGAPAAGYQPAGGPQSFQASPTGAPAPVGPPAIGANGQYGPTAQTPPPGQQNGNVIDLQPTAAWSTPAPSAATGAPATYGQSAVGAPAQAGGNMYDLAAFRSLGGQQPYAKPQVNQSGQQIGAVPGMGATDTIPGGTGAPTTNGPDTGTAQPGVLNMADINRGWHTGVLQQYQQQLKELQDRGQTSDAATAQGMIDRLNGVQPQGAPQYQTQPLGRPQVNQAAADGSQMGGSGPSLLGAQGAARPSATGAPATAAASGQPAGTAGWDPQSIAALQSIGQVAGAGAHRLGAGAWEALDPDTKAATLSGMQRLGYSPAKFQQQYQASRVGQRSALAA